MSIKYELIIYWSEDDQSFVVEVPELPGCMADGETYEEAVANARQVIDEWLDTARELGRPIPQPMDRNSQQDRLGSFPVTIAESIDQFCSYFEREAVAIAHVCVEGGHDIETGAGNQSRYRKTLYVTAIDTLACLRFHASAYPQLNRRNRERFIRFLREYGAWPEGDLVSLAFLKDELETSKLIGRPLGRHVTAELSKFSTEDGGSLPASSIDVPLAALMSLATTEKEEEALREYQHFALFYRYRNSLVHESRQPGTAMEVFATEGAYYHGYIGDPRWYLGYPLTLFQTLLTRSIAGFRSYLKNNQIDPYSLVDDKARW